MLFSRRSKKILSVFLLTIIVGQLLTPTVSYALTGGPTAPEFSSFEPVDTTDMVNLATGEFNYNLPLIEVPGPEGGYPLSLSYHAGIRLDQEASWVGLGFTLNPGAINRTVNGYADDNLSTQSIVKDYWGGGGQVTETYNLTLGYKGIGVNYSLANTHDTYKGFSTNSSVGLFIDPVALALHASQQSAKATGKSNVGINSRTPINKSSSLAGTAYGTGAFGQTVLGISISSKGLSTFASIGGQVIGAQNNVSGVIHSFTTEKDRGTAPIFGFGFLNLKDFYTRYWSDESQALISYGSLYPGIGNTRIGKDFYDEYGEASFASYAFDSYESYDNSPIAPVSSDASNDDKLNATADDPNDPKKQLGGSLPAYDRYEVLGQGIGGVIQPYIFENGDMYGQDSYGRFTNGDPDKRQPNVLYRSLRRFSNKKVDFRFLNDFSNSLSIDPAQLQYDDTGTNPLFPLQQTHADELGFYNSEKNGVQKLAGSRHVEWYTNEEIASGQAAQNGFMDFYQNRSDRKLDFDIYANYLQPESCLPYSGYWTYGTGEGTFVNDTYSQPQDIYTNTLLTPKFHSLKPRSADLRKKIGGFKVTNETGVDYHYSLPAYSYNEYTRTKLKKPRKGTPTFREYHNEDPYAYTWLLTAITGPDYVDANLSGTVDDGDLGYWVKFDYGRWADAYQWRTPHTGYSNEVDDDYASFSHGIKELYYLDAIETRSHKAIFIKSKRKDGRGVTSRLEGGSNPRQYNMLFCTRNNITAPDGSLTFNVAPVSTMKLDAVYLFDKKELGKIAFDKARGEMYNEATSSSPHQHFYQGTNLSYSLPTSPTTDETVTINSDDNIQVKYHNGDLVYDNDDIHDLPEFTQRALRVVKLNTDYSLTKGVPNSFGFFGDTSDKCRAGDVLNLTEVCDDLDKRINGDFEWPDTGSNNPCFDGFIGSQPFCCQQFVSDGTAVFRDNMLFYSKKGIAPRWYTERGDIHSCENFGNYIGSSLQYPRTGKLTLTGVEFLGKGGAGLIPPISFSYSNNQDYQLNHYDEWGQFKKDYSNDDDANRKITPTSANFVDAWSLTSITTSLGSKINVSYEANRYNKSVYNDFSAFPVDKIEAGDGSNVNVYFKEKALPLNDWFKVGDAMDLHAFYVYPATSPAYKLFFNTYTANEDIIASINPEQNMITVTSQYLQDMVTKSSFFVAFRGDRNGTEGATYPVTPLLFSGFVKAQDPSVKYAGGIRVNSLSMVDDSFGASSTTYEYMTSDGKSSGVTSFKPYILPSIHTPQDVDFFQTISSGLQYSSLKKELLMQQEAWQTHVNQIFHDLLTFSHETIAPGVIYGTVKSKVDFNSQPTDSYSVHQFRTYDAAMVTKDITTYSTDNLENRLVTFTSKISGVGGLISSQTFDNSGSPVKSVNYGYLFDADISPFEQAILDTKQGTVAQGFNKRVLVANYFIPPFPPLPQQEYSREKVLMTIKKELTDVVTSVEQIDYKKGTSSITKNAEFDFYSGQATKILTTDSYGKNYLSVSTPAYRSYPSMGLKIYQPLNKNMLTQGASSTNYLVDESNTPVGLLSASTQTWSDDVAVLGLDQQVNVWRKQSAFAWNGTSDVNAIDGTYPIADFSANTFNFSDLTKNLNWEKTSEITLYDPYSHPLESVDINSNRSSTKMDPKQTNVIASTTNGAYSETGYSGVEFSSGNSVDEGDIDRGDGSVTNMQSHTGRYSLLVGSGKTGFNFTLKSAKADLSKNYHVSVWCYIPGAGEVQSEMNKVQLFYSVNGVEKNAHPMLQKSKSKNWYLMNLDIVPDGNNDIVVGTRNNSGRGVYFDDFRVHPLDAAMVAYVYDSFSNEMIYQLDANNIYTHYEYDAMGRLVRKSREQLNNDFGDGKESFKPDRITGEVLYNYGKKN